MFSRPDTSAAGFAKPAELLGHLVIIKPTDFEPLRSSEWGEKDTVTVDVADVDEDCSYLNSYWSQVALVAKLKDRINELILARIQQAPAKPGRHPAWVLTPVDDEKDIRRAEEWMTHNPDFHTPHKTSSAASSAASPF